ncbi:hypothetical protein D2C89_04030 [Helicobacter pylori]|nr:hypothetical protein D2C89_04030 [Helicobacter pylori]QEE98132.1 hypothetical protein D2C88_01510 [Helicobacter pylori]
MYRGAISRNEAAFGVFVVGLAVFSATPQPNDASRSVFSATPQPNDASRSVFLDNAFLGI